MVSRDSRIVFLVLLLLACSWPMVDTKASPHFMIQVMGDFNDWDTYSPSMTPISTTQWADTLNVDAGCTLIKFRTNFIWDTNPDYGRCSGVEGPCQIQVPADIQDPLVDETCLINGPLAIGEVEFLVTGSYEFILDESASTYSIRYLGAPLPLGSISGTVAFADNPPGSPVAFMVAIVSGSEILAGLVETDPADDSFLMEELPTGTYDLWFASAGYEDLILEGVAVNAPDDSNLGTITLKPANTITMMQVLGDFNQWDIQAPPMSHPSSFVWVDTLSVEAGCSFIKFRTNGIWGDDYCRCSGSEGPCQSPVPADAALVLDVCLGSGTGNALGEVEFPESADYVFIVNEQTFTCTILPANVVKIEGVSWGHIKALYR